MALITPLSPDSNEEVTQLVRFFNETLGFCPDSVLTMQIRPAIAKAFINLNRPIWVLNRWNDCMAIEMEVGAVLTGNEYLAGHGWSVGKHR